MKNKELVIVEEKNVLVAFTDGSLDPIIKQAKDLVDSFDYDLSTGVSRAKIASLSAKVSKFKVKLDDIGKDLTSDWKAKSLLVDKSRKKMRDELDELRDLARKPLTDWEDQQKVIADEKLAKEKADQEAQEKLVCHEMAILINTEHDRKIADRNLIAQKEAKELADQQEKDRIARDDKLKADAAQQAKLEAEQVAQAKLDKIEKEKQQVIDQVNQVKIDAEVAKKEKLAAEWLVYISEAYSINDGKNAERQLKLEAQQAEQRRLDSIEATKQAEIKRQNDEIARVERETIAREADEKYRRRVHSEILHVLVSNGLSKEAAKIVVTLAARKQIPKMSINY